MKSFASKSGAKKAALRKGAELENIEFHTDKDGRWVWKPILAFPKNDPELDAELQLAKDQEDKELFTEPPKPKTQPRISIPKSPKVAPVATSQNGLKIEKDRPEQNGIIRPSVGGKCRAIWNKCDSLYRKGRGHLPMPQEIKQLAKDNDWNTNNAVIEMYQWRKFHGISGRQ